MQLDVFLEVVGELQGGVTVEEGDGVFGGICGRGSEGYISVQVEVSLNIRRLGKYAKHLCMGEVKKKTYFSSEFSEVQMFQRFLSEQVKADLD